MDTKPEKKFGKVMHEWGEGKLHSGSKHGPKVESKKQAEAIAYSEAHKKRKEMAKKVVGDEIRKRAYSKRMEGHKNLEELRRKPTHKSL